MKKMKCCEYGISGLPDCKNLKSNTFIPASMGVKWPKGTSRVASSHRRVAKLHMSAAFVLIVFGDLQRASGAILGPIL
jgi:hypothetical protein